MWVTSGFVIFRSIIRGLHRIDLSDVVITGVGVLPVHRCLVIMCVVAIDVLDVDRRHYWCYVCSCWPACRAGRRHSVLCSQL